MLPMFYLRSVLPVIALFAVGFLGVRWLMDGAPIPLLHRTPLTADARLPTFVESSRKHIAEARDQEWLEAKTAQSDHDPDRDRLRDAVIETATAFTLSPCNAALKQKYVEAAAAYARAFITVAGCPKYPTCMPDDALMEKAKQLFKSPADGRVKQAMRTVHDMGINARDYPDKIGPVVAHLAESGYPFDEEFSCTSQQASAAARSLNQPVAAPPPPTRNVDNTPDRREIDRQSREHYRNRTLESLRRPGPQLCADPQRTLFVAGVNQYYAMRFSQQHGSGVRTPEEQAQIERAWSTALDQQIDSLVRDFVVEGYIRRQDLKKSPIVDQVLSGVTPNGHACAGKS